MGQAFNTKNRQTQMKGEYLFRKTKGLRFLQPTSCTSTRRLSCSSPDDDTASPFWRLRDRSFFIISSKRSRRFCTPSGSIRRDSSCSLSPRLRRLESTGRRALPSISASTRLLSCSSSDDDTASPLSRLRDRSFFIISSKSSRRFCTPYSYLHKIEPIIYFMNKKKVYIFEIVAWKQ